MRTTAGPVPAERTKMSAPAGLWTIWDLKVEGKAGCAVAIWAESTATTNAIMVLVLILERRPIHFSLRSAVSINITSAGSRDDLDGRGGAGNGAGRCPRRRPHPLAKPN